MGKLFSKASALATLLTFAGAVSVVSQAESPTPADLVRSARIASVAGDHDLALSHFLEAIGRTDTSDRGGRADAAFLWNEVSVLRRRQGALREALDASNTALSLAARDPPHPTVVAYLINHGLAAGDLGVVEAASDSFERAVRTAGSMGAEAHDLRTVALRHLARIELVRGRYDRAIETLDDPELLSGADASPSDAIEVLHLMARAHIALRQVGEARSAVDRALSLAGNSVEPAVVLEGRVLDARVARLEARPDHAEEQLESVRRKAGALGDAGQVPYASALYNLAELEFMRGRFSEAETLNQAAELAYAEALVRDHPVIAQTLHRRAVIHQELGDLETAIGLYDRAARLFEDTVGRGHPLWLSSQAERVQTLARLGRDAEAVELGMEVIGRLDAHAGRMGYDQLLARASLGLAFHELGDRDAARRTLEEVRRVRGEREFPVVDEPPALNALAEIYLADGRIDEARDAIGRAMAILETTQGHTVDRLSESRRILAEVERAVGRSEAALALARANVDAAEARLGELSRQASYLSEFAPTLMRGQVGQALDLLWEHGGGASPRLAAEMFEAAQLVHLNETTRATNGVVRRLVAADDRTSALLEERRVVSGELRTLAALLVDRASEDEGSAADDLLGRLAALRERRRALDDALAESAPDLLAILTPEPVAAQAIQATLTEGEAFWMQATFDEATYLFLIRDDGLSVARTGYGAADLTADVDGVRATLDLERNPAASLPFDVERASSLFEGLLGPFSEALGEVDKLVLVPDLAAQQLSLATLVREDARYGRRFGAGHESLRFLGLTHALNVVPSPTSFLRWRRSGDLGLSAGGFVGFGDPILRGTGEMGARGAAGAITRGTGLADPRIISEAFEPLPETETELRGMVRGRNSTSTRLYLREAATETVVKSLDYADAQVIAFATHAVVSGSFDHLTEPALVLTPPTVPTALDDGLLTASEIAQMSLRAEMVVLSACNTGSPSGRPGASGLSGLASGFFQAGARSLVVSHWAISTVSSVLLMPRFLEEAAGAEPAPPSEAMRRAMLALANDERVEELAHPAIWAPFTVIGDR